MLRVAVLEHLNERLGLSAGLDPANPGRVVVRAADLRRWLDAADRPEVADGPPVGWPAASSFDLDEAA